MPVRGNFASIALSHVMGASIFCSFAKPVAAPRNTSRVPSVMMKGISFSFVISKPFAAPHRPPTRMPAQAAAQGDQPASSSRATTTVDNAITEPALKSMPPAMMISVIPSAPAVTITLCVSTVTRLKLE